MRRKLYDLLYMVAVATAFAGCDSGTVYYQYRHTPVAGWEKNDTLSFNTTPMEVAGRYEECVGLRINNKYPFKSVTLIIEQKVLPQNIVMRDTVDCMLTNSKGTIQGNGFTYFQYMFPLAGISLGKGDSLSINVRHGMRREILSGIEDIGVRISKI